MPKRVPFRSNARPVRTELLLGSPLTEPSSNSVLTGLAFDGEGRLFTSVGAGGTPGTSTPQPVGLIDLGSRSFTQIGLGPGSLSDIAIGPVAAGVPEPSSLALLGLGTAALAGWRWRRQPGPWR
jgi:hypothetical protein